ncbi:hypothetical protein [Ferruginibacter sp.]|nr:hypothetical protein [Ferruginibacter sp.]
MLYERDYRKLSDEEKIQWQKAEEILNKSKVKNDGGIVLKEFNSYYKILSDEALHHKQLFPNNYLNTRHLKDKEKLTETIEEFKRLLDSSATERDILNFIRDKRAYFIIASILKGYHYRFGHHNAFAFKEFELPPNHLVDYLLVGKSSGGYEFIFVELENSYGQITNVDGEFGTTIRKGIKQVNDWDNWIESNFSSLRLVFDKYIGTIEQLPREFYELDKSRLHYVVVAGRRKDFLKKTYQLKRKLLKSNNILLLHYDNLFDSVDFLLTAGNY